MFMLRSATAYLADRIAYLGNVCLNSTHMLFAVCGTARMGTLHPNDNNII